MFITVLIAVIFRFTDFIQKLLLHLKLPFLKTNIYSFCFYMYNDKFVYFGNVDVFWPKFIWKLKNIRKLNNTMINWYVTFCYFYLFFNGKFKLWCQLDSLVKWLLEFLSMSWWQILSQNFLIIIIKHLKIFLPVLSLKISLKARPLLIVTNFNHSVKWRKY